MYPNENYPMYYPMMMMPGMGMPPQMQMNMGMGMGMMPGMVPGMPVYPPGVPGMPGMPGQPNQQIQQSQHPSGASSQVASGQATPSNEYVMHYGQRPPNSDAAFFEGLISRNE